MDRIKYLMYSLSDFFPFPGGTRRVVLLLPDGNLMMTEVDEEQYAALELDK